MSFTHTSLLYPLTFIHSYRLYDLLKLFMSCYIYDCASVYHIVQFDDDDDDTHRGNQVDIQTALSTLNTFAHSEKAKEDNTKRQYDLVIASDVSNQLLLKFLYLQTN